MSITRSPDASNPPLETLSDLALLNQFGDLVQQDRDRTASLLRHIDAIDRRKLWAKWGHPSLFDFLVTRFHMSESTAGKRIGAARSARRFPILFGMVARGEIHLSGIHRLKAHLTHENHEQVLAAAKHKTIRQVEELIARLAPQPDAPSTLRRVPQRPAPTLLAPIPARQPIDAAASDAAASDAAVSDAAVSDAAVSDAAVSDASTLAAPAACDPPARVGPAPPPRSPDPAPLSPGRYRLQVTIGQASKDRLEQLQDLLAHQIPNGDPAAIIERALDVLWTQVHKRKTAITDKPRASRPTTQRTRNIKASERREVWPRDDGRCGFVGEDGHRCNATRGLEFAHVHPWAKGGDNTALNLSLRCPAHNGLEADRDYGTGFMASKRKRQHTTKPLKVREPIARYLVWRVVHGAQLLNAVPDAQPPSNSRTLHARLGWEVRSAALSQSGHTINRE